MAKVSINRVVFVLVVTLLSILLIARDIASLSMNKFVYLAICALGILFTDMNSFMQLLSFIFPLMCGLPGTYVILVAVARFIFIEGLDKRTIKYILFVIMFEMFASIWYGTMLDSDMVHQMLALCLLFIMLHNHKGVDYYKCLQMYWLGTVIVAFVIVCSTLMNAPSDWLSLFAKGWFRFGSDSLEDIQTMTLRLNANTLAYYSLVSTMFGIIMVIREKGIVRLVVFIGTVFLMLSGVLTNSRSWLLIVGGCLALYYLSQVRNVKYLFVSVIIALLLAGAAWKLTEIAPELLTGITTRMTDETMADGNGRIDIAIECLQAMSNDIRVALAGAGTTHYMRVLNLSHATHNGTIQILISYGLVGSVIFFWGIVSPLWENGVHKAPVLYWLPFIGCVLFVQTIQFINPCFLIYPYIVAVYALLDGSCNTHANR